MEETVWVLFEGSSSQQKSRRYSAVCRSCVYLSWLQSGQLQYAFSMVSILQTILESLRPLLELKLQSLEVFSAAILSQFAKTIGWRLFGFCLMGRAASEKVEDIPPPAAGTSLAIKSWQNSSPFFRSCLGGMRRFALLLVMKRFSSLKLEIVDH